MQDDLVKKTKFLAQLLLFSITLNVGLLATFAYFTLKGKQQVVSMPAVEASTQNKPFVFSNQELLRAYSHLPFSQLVSLLYDKSLIEEGYSKRDLALASLVAFHHFNLERALGGAILQQRVASFLSADGQQNADLTIFPGLAEYQYQAIIKYAKTEKWPFTSQGIFYEIQKGRVPRDPSLLEAFYLTPEFSFVLTLMNRSGLKIDKELFVEMLARGEWEILSRFWEQQKLAADFSEHRRREFLLEYVQRKSKIGVMLLLQTDREFVSKRMSDQDILNMLDLISDSNALYEKFLKELLISPRSDAVWKKASARLYQMAGENPPEPYDHMNALERFIPAAQLVKNSLQTPPKITLEAPKPKEIIVKPKVKTKTHTVQEGESLWKIARKYKVSIEEIMKHNQLQSEKLKPGKKLEIPQGTSSTPPG